MVAPDSPSDPPAVKSRSPDSALPRRSKSSSGIRASRLEPPRQAAHLVVQPVERRRIFRCAGRPRGVGGLRQLVEPGVQLIERLAIAALALLDPLDEPAEQALDRPLVHGTVV